MLNRAFCVSSDVKRMGLKNLHSREQRLEVVDDELLKPDKIKFLGGGRLGCRFRFGFFQQTLQRHQLRQAVGNLDAREVLRALRVPYEDSEIQA